MRLISNAVAAPIDEEDPLPPDNRLPTALALEELYRTHASRLRRYFARRSDSEDANDLVQESFVRLARADAASPQRIERPEAYLNQIATNLLRNRAKSALQRSLSRQVSADDVPLAGGDMIAAREARDILNRLDQALMRLSPKTRAIFLAHRIDGFSYKEIATRMGLRVKSVEWHMSKAIAHLDRALRTR